MQDRPCISPINLVEVTNRADNARNIISGFSLAMPSLARLWQQVGLALSDVPELRAEIAGLRDSLTASRIDRANLAAAGRATIAAYRNGEPDPLSYLDDELVAQGFSAGRGNT